MIIPAETIASFKRGFDADLSSVTASVITDTEWVWDGEEPVHMIITFDVEPSAQEKEQLLLFFISANDVEFQLVTRCKQALALNNEWLAIASPTAAEAFGYLDTVARELNGLIRLILHWLDATD